MTTSHPLLVLESVATLRAQVAAWRRAGDTIALVPTMGALHAGHLSLVHLARAAFPNQSVRVVVSIFVNPTQFAPGEDFTAYPRTFDTDADKLQTAGADAVFYPAVAEMYGAGFATVINPQGAALAGLEDAVRPTHFAGVALVVTKLLQQCGPDLAVFGEKDFQQLAVIRQTVRDLDIPVAIVGAPIVREMDGLAMSSRNAYLSAAQRSRAPTLFATLQEVVAALREGTPWREVQAKGRVRLQEAGFVVDYLELRDAQDLTIPQTMTRGSFRLLVAAQLGRTRLLDNMALDLLALDLM